jgi:hypothetical protein
VQIYIQKRKCVCVCHTKQKGIKNFRLLLAMIPRSAHINSPWNRRALAHSSTQRLRRLCWTRVAWRHFMFIYTPSEIIRKRKKGEKVSAVSRCEMLNKPHQHMLCVCVLCVAVSPSLLSIYSTRIYHIVSLSLFMLIAVIIYTPAKELSSIITTRAPFSFGVWFSLCKYFSMSVRNCR